MTTLDWTVAQALGGQMLDGELHRLRAQHEATLQAARGDFHTRRTKANAERGVLEAASREFPDLGIDADTVLAVSAVALPAKAQALQRERQICEAFRLRHGLTRSATEPQTLQSLLFLGILVFVEAGVNAGFFQNAYMAASPLSGLLVSLLISLTNVSLSTSAGFFIGRWRGYGLDAADADEPAFMRRREAARRHFWTFVGFLALFHITVGLVRAQEELETVQHGFFPYLSLLTTPEALFLMLIGGCLSVVAYHKGMNAFDDPYPGYGLRQRAVRAAYDDLLDLFDEASEAIEDRYAEALGKVEDLRKTRTKAVSRYEQSVLAALSARRELERAVGEAEAQLRAKIAQLANLHRGARGEKAPLAEGTLDHLASFREFLSDCDPPPFYHPPDMSEPIHALDEAKALALRRLGQLFEQIQQPDGETP